MKNVIKFNRPPEKEDLSGVPRYKKYPYVLLVFVFVFLTFLLSRLSSDYIPSLKGLSSHYSNYDPVVKIVDGRKEVHVKMNSQGRYLTSGKIKGKDVLFLIDTGATSLAIPNSVASELNLVKGRHFFARTAGGKSIYHSTTVPSITVGNITIDNVRGGIGYELHGSEILLGMTFLSKIEMKFKDGYLIMSQQI